MQFVNCLRHGPKQQELRGQKMARWTKQLAAPNKCWPCQHRQKGTCMKKSSAIERTSALVLAPPTGRVTVLCISPLDEDHLSFHAIIGQVVIYFTQVARFSPYRLWSDPLPPRHI